VISVQTIVLSFESIQSEGNHNWLKSLSFFFGQTLRARWRAEQSVPLREWRMPGHEFAVVPLTQAVHRLHLSQRGEF
jgi:hypothetical protein